MGEAPPGSYVCSIHVRLLTLPAVAVLRFEPVTNFDRKRFLVLQAEQLICWPSEYSLFYFHVNHNLQHFGAAGILSP